MLLNNAARVENYINQFIQNDCPFYLVTKGAKSNFVIIDRNDGAKAETDINVAADKLRQTLSREYQNDDRCKLQIVCYDALPVKGKKLDATKYGDYTISCVFHPDLMDNGYTPRQNMYGIPQRDEALNMKVEQLTNAVAMLTTKIEMQDAQDDEDLEDEAQPNVMNGLLGALASNPTVQQLLVNVLANVATNGMNKPTQTVGLAGIEDTDLETAINTLMEKGVTVSDLIKLAAMDKVQIDFLLGMLRK